MDLPSHRRLEDLCMDLLVEKPDPILWRQKDGSQLSKPNGVEWRDPNIFLTSQFADKLLQKLSHDETLRDGILSTFTQEHVYLQHAKINNSHDLKEDMLQVLSDHKLISLDMECPSKMNISTVLKCFGNKSNESLQHLFLGRPEELWGPEDWPRDDDLCGQSVIETLSRFNCLKRVDVRYTELSDTNLAILGTSLLHVENLNLSGNDDITDISPLKNCQKTLKSLSLCGLRDMTADSAMATFVTLTGLTYLDVSLKCRTFFDSYDESECSQRGGMKMFTADMLLRMPDVLPNLVCLDLSGRTVRCEQVLSQFLDAHQSLKMLVLWGSAACQFKSLQDYRPRLTVGGDATLEQFVAVLWHWTRTDQHQRIPFEFSKRQYVMDKLNRDLKMGQFPPCENDHLVQVVLGMLPTCSTPLCDQNIRILEWSCLRTISRALRKKIIRHVEPDTKQHVLQFCHRIVQKYPESYALKWAEKIKNALG